MRNMVLEQPQHDSGQSNNQAVGVGKTSLQWVGFSTNVEEGFEYVIAMS